MNCPRCGRLALPRLKHCLCGESLAWPPLPVAQQKRLPHIIEHRLSALGIEQRPNETLHEFAARCREYTLARFSLHHTDQAA